MDIFTVGLIFGVVNFVLLIYVAVRILVKLWDIEDKLDKFFEKPMNQLNIYGDQN